jgi:RES domain-containing protein
VLVWRIARERYQALDGEGARLNGGRWNSERVPVVYASPTLALAALEYLVHVDPEDVPEDLMAMQIDIPDGLSEKRVPTSELPADWNEMPDHPARVRRGDAWMKDASIAVLRVPSAIVPEEENILINPKHVDARQVTVVHTRPFAFDPRLLARSRDTVVAEDAW